MLPKHCNYKIVPFFFSFLILVFLFSIFSSKIQAANQFSTAYDTLYEVQDNNSTRVTQRIALTNLTSQFYTSAYTLTISSDKISQITVADEMGPLRTSIDQKDGTTQIKAEFNQKVAGKGRVLHWTVSYINSDIASKNGRVWEVIIPQINDENITNYQLTLAVPSYFEEASFISPKPFNVIREGNSRRYLFNDNKVVTATFGQFQTFHFNLKYHLDNSYLVPIITEIALPPSTAYQDVLYESITPTPFDVTTDKDGNWLAKFKLLSNQKIDVTTQGVAKIYPFPQKNQEANLSTEERKTYLEAQKYWEIANPNIAQKARELKTPEAIYNFVVGFLKYDSSRLNSDEVTRLGAAEALKKPDTSVCMEFTDLFIALARAAGIPAREINGFAYTTDTKLRPLSLGRDILHAWPEYWDDTEQTWIQIDPTWGSTTKGGDYFSKLDLNHFAFVIHGQSSEKPYPAGSYSADQKKGHNVEIDFAPIFPNIKSQLEVGLNIPTTISAGLPLTADLVVKNTGNTIVKNSNLTLFTSQLNIMSDHSFNLGDLPPFAERSIKIYLKNDNWFTQANENILVRINNQEYNFPVNVKPFFLIQLLPIIGGIIGGAILAATSIILGKKSRRLHLFRRK